MPTLKPLGIAILFSPLFSIAAGLDTSSTVTSGALQSATINMLSQASTNIGVQFAPNTSTSAASGSSLASVDSATWTPKASLTTGNVNASASSQQTNAVATAIFKVNALSIVPVISGNVPLAPFTISAP